MERSNALNAPKNDNVGWGKSSAARKEGNSPPREGAAGRQEQKPEGFGSFRNANAVRTTGGDAKPSGPPMFSNSGKNRNQGAEEAGKGFGGFRGENAGAKQVTFREEEKPAPARGGGPPQFTNSRGGSASGNRGGSRGGSAGSAGGFGGGFSRSNPAAKK